MAVLNSSRAYPRSQARHAVHLRADPSSASASTLTATATPTAESSHHDDHELTPATKALAVLVVIFGLLVIGVVAWRIGVWRRRKVRARTGAASRTINIASMRKTFRKAVPLYFNDTPSTPGLEKGGMDTSREVNVLLPGKHTASMKTVKTFVQMPSPPPTYQVSGNATSGQVPPPISIPITARPPGIDTLSKEHSHSQSPIVPTPRTASFGPEGKSRPSTMSSKISNGLQPPADLPRIVTVLNTFVPSLSDELSIRLGETLRMLEEYEDGWCLVQRISAPDEKGVIPQFCVH
ncbi:hypothetical protein BKA93DRAFT_541326 [Sparassis latifolia]